MINIVKSVENPSDWDSVTQNIQGYELYKIAYFAAYGGLDESLTFYDRVGKVVALLPLKCEGKSLVSHPNMFVGGFIWNSGVTNLDIKDSIIQLKKYIDENNKTLILKQGPECISIQTKAESKYFEEFGFKLTFNGVTHAIDLNSNPNFSSRRMRSLKSAIKNKYRVVWLNDLSAINQHVEKLSSTYASFGLRMSLGFERVKFLFNQSPSSIFFPLVVDQNLTPLGGAIAYHHGGALRVPIYANFIKGHGITELLIREICQLALASDSNYVDLGTSIDPNTNQIQEGIVSFKEESGARPYSLYKWELN